MWCTWRPEQSGAGSDGGELFRSVGRERARWGVGVGGAVCEREGNAGMKREVAEVQLAGGLGHCCVGTEM